MTRISTRAISEVGELPGKFPHPVIHERLALFDADLLGLRLVMVRQAKQDVYVSVGAGCAAPGCLQNVRPQPSIVATRLEESEIRDAAGCQDDTRHRPHHAPTPS